MRRGIVHCGVAALLFGASTPFAAQLAHEMKPVHPRWAAVLGAALAVVPGSLRYRPMRPRFVVAGRLAIAVVSRRGRARPARDGAQTHVAASASLLLNLELVFTVVLPLWSSGAHRPPVAVEPAWSPSRASWSVVRLDPDFRIARC